MEIPADQPAVSVTATKVHFPYRELQGYHHFEREVLTGVVQNLQAASLCGPPGRVTVPGDPVGDQRYSSLPQPQCQVSNREPLEVP